MTAPNRNTLWATAMLDELAAAGVDRVVVSPGSRSTPLTMAAARHATIHVDSLLDERSAAFYALGRARRTGRVTPLVCTSGTAAANYHPAIMEASNARVPLLALTADRPPELRDSGANQTADQEKLYGDAVRWYADLPEPAATDRALRSLRTTIARAVATAEGSDAGPVHLNVPFAKPLEPTPVPGDVPEDLDTVSVDGRDGPFVDVTDGTPTPDEAHLNGLADALTCDRGIIVAGPADPPGLDPEAVAALSHATGFPILADPLSGVRYGGHTRVAPVIGSYDTYLSGALAHMAPAGTSSDETAEGSDDRHETDGWAHPEVVLRLGAAPTSKRLRTYLAGIDTDQYVVDPAGRWREAGFTATDLVIAEPNRLCADLARMIRGETDQNWKAQWTDADRIAEAVHSYTSLGESAADSATTAASATDASTTDPATTADSVTAISTAPNAAAEARPNAGISGASSPHFHEGDVLRTVVASLPEPSTLFVSNSMPVRDLDRFVPPAARNLTTLGNRGVSGIDGIVSSALGAGSATTDDLTLVLGDLALYHDTNGLLAIDRCAVDATIVVINNDGGGIFHALPVADFEPPFTDQFLTPHGLDFESMAALHGLQYTCIDAQGESGGMTTEDSGAEPRESTITALSETVQAAHAQDGSHLIEVRVDGSASHRVRESLRESVERAVHGQVISSARDGQNVE